MYYIDSKTKELLDKIDLSSLLRSRKEVVDIMEEIEDKAYLGEYGDEIKEAIKDEHFSNYLLNNVGMHDFMAYCSDKYHTQWVVEEKYYAWN